MSRFPKDDLEALKATVDVAAVIGAVVSLEPQGSDLVGRCPFHDEATASFKVTPHKNLWHCFGCGAGGDVIEFVVKHQRVSFRHAVELLKARAPLSTSPTRTGRKLPSPITLGSDHAAALDDVAAFYHSTLLDSPDALAYFEKRGISSEAIAHFGLGYANRTLGLHLPAKNRIDGEQLRGLLTDVGVYRESGHEHLAGSVVVPLLDVAGRVVGMYGRKLLTNLRPGTAKHLYLPGPHRGVFNGAALSSSTEVVLCESLIDALTFWSAGIENVTTSYGVEGFTAELLSTLKSAGVRTVLIAYDADDAGNTAAAALTMKLEGEGFVVGRVQFPKGMDANEYALTVKPATKSLHLVVDRARESILKARGVVVDARTPAPVAAPTITTTKTETPPPTPLAASPPATETPAMTTTIESPTASPAKTSDELVIELGDRRYRVRGLLANTSPTVLKVNLMVHRGRAFFVDTIDLYQVSQRQKFMVTASRELDTNAENIKGDLSDLLLRLETAQQEMLAALLTAKKKEPPPMSADNEAAALALLKRPDLVDEILRDFDRCGVVGERENKLLGYFAMTSRKMATPLGVAVQSSSAAGKSSVMDAVLAFCPPEDTTRFSAMTAQSLFYMGQGELKHQVLAIAEEEGAKNASLALKLMQSDGEVTIAAPGKDPTTGRLTTVPYKVEGPVMLFITTTSIEVEEELMNRCIVLAVNEDREQTRAIHERQRQRRTLQGRLLGGERSDVLTLHQNAQRLLKPFNVVNPYAMQLTFIDDKTRTRRDHMKYLVLIEAIALVHQHQRPLKVAEHDRKVFEYIEVTLDDIRLANELAHVTLGRSLDELPPHTRKLLTQLDAHVRGACAEKKLDRRDVRLTRREVLDVSGLSLTQLRVHLQRLVDLEHVLVHAGKRGLSFVYEVLFDGKGDDGAPHLSGLIDVDTLADERTISTSRGDGGAMAGSKRGVGGGPPAMSVVDVKTAETSDLAGLIANRVRGSHGLNGVRTSMVVDGFGDEL